MTLTAALTAGPVGPSDKIGNINRDLVMRTSREDGKLLKADEPSMPLDVVFSSTFNQPNANLQIWQSSTTISNLQYHYVFGAELSSPFTIHITDLPSSVPTPTQTYVAFDYFAIYSNVSNSGPQASTVDSKNPLVIPTSGAPGLKNTTVNFRYYVLAPQTAQCTLLGEFSKFITVSKQRITSISAISTGVTVFLTGAPSEKVDIWFVKSVSAVPNFIVLSTTLNQNGSGSVTCN